MSVLACNRSNCPEIMCQRLILDGHAYICDDCWCELLEYKNTWPSVMSKAEVRERIEAFMKTPPGAVVMLEGGDIEREFLRLTSGPRG